MNLPSSNYYYSRNQTPRCHSRTRCARESGGSRVAHKDAIFRTRVAKKKMVYGFNARLITHLTADPILLSSPLPPLPPPRLSQFSRLSPLPLLLSFVLHANRAKRFFPWKNSSSVFCLHLGFPSYYSFSPFKTRGRGGGWTRFSASVDETALRN